MVFWGLLKPLPALRPSLDVLRDEMKELQEVWVGHSAHFSNVDDRMAKVLRGLNGELEKSLEKMSGFVSKTDQSFAGAITALQGAIDEFADQRIGSGN